MTDQVHVGARSLVLEYKWKPSGIERRVGTILSKMIKFRGEILFRVGVKNEESISTLLFMTFDASKVGIDEAVATIRSLNGPARMHLYEEEGDSTQRSRY